jgi:hypothetical protein
MMAINMRFKSIDIYNILMNKLRVLNTKLIQLKYYLAIDVANTTEILAPLLALQNDGGGRLCDTARCTAASGATQTISRY